MDTLVDLPFKLASCLITIALIFMAIGGPPKGPGTQKAHNQLEFPFMAESPLRKLPDALDRKVRRLIAYNRAGVL